MDLSKVDVITSWLMPKHVKDVQVFLGLTNFYHQLFSIFQR